MGDAPARRIPLWVEPCAGSLAVGLRLLGGRAVCGYMGGKSGYADAIMSALDVGAADEVWCADVSDWAQVWRALAKPGVGPAAADILEGWRDSLPDAPPAHRALWLQLREDWRAQGTTLDAIGVARWFALVIGSALMRGPAAAPCWRKDMLEWRLFQGRPMAERIVGIPHAARLRALPSPLPVRVWDDARAIPARRGAVVYLDPPYAGTTGYGHGTLARAEVEGEVERWTRAGCVVAVSESGDLPGSVRHDLTAMRHGCARLRGSSKREILHVYRPGLSPSQPTLWDPVR